MTFCVADKTFCVAGETCVVYPPRNMCCVADETCVVSQTKRVLCHRRNICVVSQAKHMCCVAGEAWFVSPTKHFVSQARHVLAKHVLCHRRSEVCIAGESVCIVDDTCWVSGDWTYFFCLLNGAGSRFLEGFLACASRPFRSLSRSAYTDNFSMLRKNCVPTSLKMKFSSFSV